nr:hypothetical protein [Bradyrhizobium diazoefficiens]
MRMTSKFAVAIATFACSALFSFGWSESGGVSLSVESAEARVGRPGTPLSVAGVARRQTRRAYGYGYGAAGAAAVGAAVVGTAAAVAATRYYGGPGYYAGGPYYPAAGYYGSAPYGYGARPYAGANGFTCVPGSMVVLDDGRTYPCQ